MSYYWNVVKNMNDSQKLELITLLAESVKSTEKDVPAYETLHDGRNQCYA